VEDLSDAAYDFDNKAFSLQVFGPCTWQVYVDANYSGKSKTFGEGSYKNAVDIGPLLRRISSVENKKC